MNNFYTILPSNSCPLIHPENNASNFNIELENAINLDGQWEVALLDFTFVYSRFPLYSKSMIEYSSIQEETKAMVVTVHNHEKRISVSFNDILEICE